MAFIDKLLEGGSPYGMEIEEPKAHDEINRLVMDNDVQSIVQGLVMGIMGGGANIGKEAMKVLRKINVRKAKAIRNLKSGTVEVQQTLKPKDAEWLKNQMNKWEGLGKEKRYIKGEKVFPSSGRPENLLNTMMLTLASPLIAKNLVDVGYGQLEGEPLNIGMPAKRK